MKKPSPTPQELDREVNNKRVREQIERLRKQREERNGAPKQG